MPWEIFNSWNKDSEAVKDALTSFFVLLLYMHLYSEEKYFVYFIKHLNWQITGTGDIESDDDRWS